MGTKKIKCPCCGEIVPQNEFTGGIVYDPFFGSGTTGLVAHRLNRKFIGSEISKEYCEIAEKRINVELNQMKLF